MIRSAWCKRCTYPTGDSPLKLPGTPTEAGTELRSQTHWSSVLLRVFIRMQYCLVVRTGPGESGSWILSLVQFLSCCIAVLCLSFPSATTVIITPPCLGV